MSSTEHPETGQGEPRVRDTEPFIVLSQEEFAVVVVDFFRTNVIAAGEIGHRKLYEMVARSVVCFQQYVNSGSYIDTYLELLFSLFEIFHVNGSNPVRDILKIYVYRKLVNHSVWRIEGKTLMPPMECVFIERPRPATRPSNGEKVERHQFPFFFLLMDSEMTRRLLRFGLQVTTSSPAMCTHLTHFMAQHVLRFMHLKAEVRWDFSKMCSTYDTYQKGRLCFVLTALSLMVQKEKAELREKSQQTLDNLKFVFKAMKEPYILVSDVSRFLSLVIVDSNKDSQIEELCKEFVNIFPGSAGPLVPRSLKHLSRCRVRKSMAVSGTLPHGVWSLDIPRELQDYLLLQRTKNQFYPKYVSSFYTRKCRFPNGDRVSKRQKTTNS